jgi:hypothetical protein
VIVELKKYFCYHCSPIDWWDGWRTVPEMIAAEGSSTEKRTQSDGGLREDRHGGRRYHKVDLRTSRGQALRVCTRPQFSYVSGGLESPPRARRWR